MESINRDNDIINFVDKFNECDINIEEFMEEFYVHATEQRNDEKLHEDMYGVGNALGKGWNAMKSGVNNLRQGFQQGNGGDSQFGGDPNYQNQLSSMAQAYSILQKAGLDGAFRNAFDQYYNQRIKPVMNQQGQGQGQGQPSNDPMLSKMNNWNNRGNYNDKNADPMTRLGRWQNRET